MQKSDWRHNVLMIRAAWPNADATGDPVSSDNRATPANRILASLPSVDRQLLLAACEPVDLVFADIISQPGERIDHVYFPIDSCISLVTPIDGYAALEVGMIGNEGMLGITLTLGVDISPLHALVQVSGRALRMDRTRFRRVFAQSPQLQRRLSRYVYVLMNQVAQTAACTRFHVVEARLARWLLMTHDRAHSDAFHLTHEFLGHMLGVRRAGVTKAATSLQNQEFISYRRGNIRILDRAGLEQASCVCYLTDKQTYYRLLG
jgi:CRP-like cAMP-binding protein